MTCLTKKIFYYKKVWVCLISVIVNTSLVSVWIMPEYSSPKYPLNMDCKYFTFGFPSFL